MTVSGPKVRDFTDKDRSLDVIVEADPVYEMLMAMFVFQGESDHSEYEIAQEVVAAVEAYGDETLLTDIESIGGCGELGLALVGIAHALPEPRTAEALADHLAEVGSIDLRTLLLRNSGIKASRGHDEATISRAAKGDIDAVRELFADRRHGSKMAELLEREPEQMLADVMSVVRRFGEATAGVVSAQQEVRERDAANTRAIAKTMNPERLVEKVTNGITFEMQPQVSGVLLIPSVVIRPWVVIAEHYTLRIFAYSVSDEVLSADDDAPPAFLVDTFKALGDEKRLRLLGVLAEGDLGLKELAQRADIAKSTAHHHLRVLRSAGLVRVVIGEDNKRYGLRRDSIPEAGRLLESFLAERPATAKTDEE
ncbi:MAG: winged helix-turn-helix transcriptional regulator [Acidimicrobiia bacterium]|nr:winged helix-turn-helix transcriptional regulator [Acidimicrobiia bacterium]